MIGSVENDVLVAVERLSSLRAPEAVAAITAASAGLGTARSGVMEFLDMLRAELAGARAGIEGIDLAAAHSAITGFLDAAEARAQEMLVDPVQERVDQVEAWVRGLFAHLPLRELRAELSALVASAAAAIEKADLAGPAADLRTRLDELEERVAGIDLGTIVRDALEKVEGVITAALDAIVGALEAIGAAVDTLADAARALVEDVVDLLTTLAGAVKEAATAIAELPIDEARQEVVHAIRELRAKAEELLSGTELPEGVRPLIDQLAAQLGAIDVEGAVTKLVAKGLEKFDVIEKLKLVEKLDQVQTCLSNLVPAQIASEIEAELDTVLTGIRAFRPEGIAKLVEGFLDDAAGAVEGVDLGPARELVHRPFAELLRLFDELRPSALLRPVLDAYDDLVGTAALPDPVQASQALIGAAAGAAQGLSAPLSGAVERVVPDAQRVAAGAPVPGPAAADRVRAGDVVRMLGWLPGRLRQALAAVGPEARSEMLAAVHALVGGLAADLRRLRAEAWAVGDRLDASLDATLAPLAATHMRAQLALQTRLSVEADDGQVAVDADASIDLKASLELVAATGPAAMRDALHDAVALASGTIDGLVRDVAAAGTVIDGAAAALERSPIAALGADADAFLAALDPEPLAAELDALVDAAMARLPALVHEMGGELQAIFDRAERILLDLNPAVLLQRFLGVLDVVRDELEVLNPHTIATELDTIHGAARATLEAYDPVMLVDEAGDLLRAVAGAIRAIDLSALPGEADLPGLGAAVDRVAAAVPSAALAGAGAALADAGAALRSLDLVGLVKEAEALPTRVKDAIGGVVAAIVQEIQALLGALHYQQANASVSVSASASAGVG